jgi:hypothetical protein
MPIPDPSIGIRILVVAVRRMVPRRSRRCGSPHRLSVRLRGARDESPRIAPNAFGSQRPSDPRREPEGPTCACGTTGSFVAAARRAARSVVSSSRSSGGGAYIPAVTSSRRRTPSGVRRTSFTRRSVSWGRRSASPLASSRSTIHVAVEASQPHSAASERIARPVRGSRELNARLSLGVKPKRARTRARCGAVPMMKSRIARHASAARTDFEWRSGMTPAYTLP